MTRLALPILGTAIITALYVADPHIAAWFARDPAAADWFRSDVWTVLAVLAFIALIAAIVAAVFGLVRNKEKRRG